MASSPAHSENGNGDTQAAVLKFLRQKGSLACGEVAGEIDTHAASIFIAGNWAWKLKRAVSFGYLDFSTVAKRGDALRAELLLNRRTAPDLYVAVVPITCDDTGSHTIGGSGEPIDWLLQMRRFPDDALFSSIADRGALSARVLTRLTDGIVAFHADAEVFRSDNAAARFRAVIDGNTDSLANFPETLDPLAAVSLGESHRRSASALGALLDERGRSGRVRHAHGDMHLANIAMINGEPTLFDCLEFSTELATIDVLYDIAFLIMDLWHRGMRAEANITFNRYLDLSFADESGVALMPLFVSVRATVRAHVLAAQAASLPDEPGLAIQARAYLALAIAAMEPQAIRLVAIGGLSGTGKSSLARMIGCDIGRIPGARILRNDVLRKRLAGVPPETRLAASTYTVAAAERVYEALEIAASTMLANGQSVIADAVFGSGVERDAIKASADTVPCRFDGIWLTASDHTRLDRVAHRNTDASDANADVALAQSHLQIGDLACWRSVSTDDPLHVAAGNLRAVLSIGAT